MAWPQDAVAEGLCSEVPCNFSSVHQLLLLVGVHELANSALAAH